MAPRNDLEHSSTHDEWVKLRFIDGYALFMGYLSMGVRGLGFLVFTWTTVVLLGGFVSMVNKKDFWCLTVITLAQTAGVFNVHQKEKLSYIWKSRRDFLETMNAIIIGRSTTTARKVAGAIVVGVKLMLFALILGPLCVLYMCGLYINAAISLWRLIQHDFHSADEDPNKANMNPALDVLYSLALIQGLLFGYKQLLVFTEKKLVNVVVKKYSFEEQAGKSVSDYLLETKVGCAKDPSFSRGRNLITYAVDLMDSKSPDSYISGVSILDTIIMRPEMLTGNHQLLIRDLLGSASSSHIVQKLLQTLHSRSPRDRKIRLPAARVVAHLAGSIRLRQFRGGIQCLSSLLEICLEEDQGNTKATDHKKLLYQGLLIFGELATDEDNCKAMSNHKHLISKITGPVSSDLLHRSDHGEWSKIADASLRAMWHLVTAPGQAGINASDEISRNKKALANLQAIVDCPECAKIKERHTLAINILARTANDISGANFIWMLLSIFTDHSNDGFRGLAGESLAALSFHEESAKIVSEAKEDYVSQIFNVLERDGHKKHRALAARILEGLCIHCNNDDATFEKLKDAMSHTMPKVVGEILYSDVQNRWSSSRYDNDDDRKLQVAVLSLCSAACKKLLLPFDRMAARGNNIFSFAWELCFYLRKQEGMETDIGPKADCLKILKHSVEIAISMMETGSQAVNIDVVGNLVKSLSDVSKLTLTLDGLMLFSGDGDTTKPVTTLTELLKYADEKLGEYTAHGR